MQIIQKGEFRMKKSLMLSLMLSTSIFAADNLFEITPMIGGSWHISNDRYADDIDLTYGLRFAGRVAESVLVEVGYDRIDNADYSLPNESTDVSRYYLDVVKEFYTESKLSPYILGGMGYEYMSNEIQSMDSDFFAQYGAGVRYAAAEFLHLKAEIRHLISFDGRSDVIGMVGFSIPFGTYTREPVAVAEPERIVEEKPVLSHIHTFSVQFPFDSSAIAPKYNAEIQDFAQSMKENPNQTAIISGHTDSTGDANYNEKLSQRRADAVKEAIIQEGVEAERLQSKGYGEARPIADNATKEGRAQNRRVEAEIYTSPNK